MHNSRKPGVIAFVFAMPMELRPLSGSCRSTSPDRRPQGSSLLPALAAAGHHPLAGAVQANRSSSQSKTTWACSLMLSVWQWVDAPSSTLNRRVLT